MERKDIQNITPEMVAKEKEQVRLQDELDRIRKKIRWQRFTNRWSKFFISLGGADPEIIRSIEDEHERLAEEKKYRNTGYMLILPFIFGALGVGFLVGVLSQKWWLGLIAGIFWGLVIVFGVDKPLLERLATTRGTWRKIKHSFLRILAAVILSLISLVFLELAVFHDTIKGHIKENTAKKEKTLRDNATSDKTAIQVKLDAASNKVNKALDDLAAEVAGKGISGQSGRGSVSKEREKQVKLMQEKYSLDSLELTTNLRTIDSNLTKDITNLHENEAHSVLSQYQALDNYLDQPENTGTNVALWILRAVIVCLELFAILHAIGATPSSYFYIVHAKNRSRKALLDEQNLTHLDALRKKLLEQVSQDYESIKRLPSYNDLSEDQKGAFTNHYFDQCKFWHQRQMFTPFSDDHDE